VRQDQSLADQAVEALSAVSRMCDGVGTEAVERHMIRSMKRTAEQAIEAGLRIALDLAYQAEQLQKDLKKAQDS
jgi:hypothetical protein